MKTLKTFLVVTTMLLSSAAFTQSETTDEGVEIDGVVWATRNVATPGTFTEKPEDSGEYYQWNKPTPDFLQLSAYYPSYDYSKTTVWQPENDPCPAGWRVPTIDEFQSLLDNAENWKHDPSGQVQTIEGSRTTVDGINMYHFVNGNDTVSLPGAGLRQILTNGTLDMKENGYYWSSSSAGSPYARSLDMNSMGGWTTAENVFRANANSVRCVKKDGSDTSTPNLSADGNKTPVAFYNITGVQLQAEPETGIYIILYDDGTAEKWMK